MNTLQAKLLLWVVSGLPEDVLAAQSKQPKGLIGRFIMKPLFTKGNADLNRFILDLLQLQSDDDVLEIGFGPGQLAKHIADGLQQGKLTGLDFSDTMLAEAQKLNQHHIDDGKMELCHGCSSAMPYDDASFDKVCTANTLYFWEPVEPHLAEVHRVLKTGGKFVMGFRDAGQLQMMGLREQDFKRYQHAKVIDLLKEAGFNNVQIQSRPDSPIESHCAVAIKS